MSGIISNEIEYTCFDNDTTKERVGQRVYDHNVNNILTVVTGSATQCRSTQKFLSNYHRDVIDYRKEF